MWRIIITAFIGIGLCAAGVLYVAVSGHFTPPYWQFPILLLIGSGFALWGTVSLIVLTFKSATTYTAKEFKK